MIRLSGFNGRAQQEVAQAVKALTKQGASEFVLDVRDNRGGLYQQGAEVAKLFLEGNCPSQEKPGITSDLQNKHAGTVSIGRCRCKAVSESCRVECVNRKSLTGNA